MSSDRRVTWIPDVERWTAEFDEMHLTVYPLPRRNDVVRYGYGVDPKNSQHLPIASGDGDTPQIAQSSALGTAVRIARVFGLPPPPAEPAWKMVVRRWSAQLGTWCAEVSADGSWTIETKSDAHDVHMNKGKALDADKAKDVVGGLLVLLHSEWPMKRPARPVARPRRSDPPPRAPLATGAGLVEPYRPPPPAPPTAAAPPPGVPTLFA